MRVVAASLVLNLTTWMMIANMILGSPRASFGECVTPSQPSLLTMSQFLLDLGMARDGPRRHISRPNVRLSKVND